MEKDLKISNIKGLLIFLVVFGHFIEIFRLRYFEIYLLIYSFHMPLFIFISGYLSKRPSFKKVLNFLLIYLIFQTAYAAYFYVIKTPFDFQYSLPYYHLWYLLSMVFWMLFLLVIKPFKSKPIKLIIFFSVVVFGLLSRYFMNYNEDFTSYTFSIQRSFTFLPFFVAGYYFTSLDKLTNYIKNHRLLTFLLSCVLVLYVIEKNKYNWESLFRGSFDYNIINNSKEAVLLLSVELGMAHLLLSFLMSVVVLNLVSKKNTLLTNWGDRSLPIFLLHPIFVYAFNNYAAKHVNPYHDTFILLLIVIITYFSVRLLSSNIVSDKLHYVLNPVKLFDKGKIQYQKNNASLD